MCLAIPMEILAIDGATARCENRGVGRDVNLFLLQDEDVNVGDCVLVHVGFAIRKLGKAQARSAWQTWDAIHAQADEDDHA